MADAEPAPAAMVDTKRFAKIFMPLATEKVATAEKQKQRFVHYTTAENALNIIRSKRIFMRNTLCMNDYTEFQHGLKYLSDFFRGDTEERKQLFSAINGVADHLAEEALALFDRWLPHNQYNIYVACISEHFDEEDQIGRLSMWRAYSRPGSVGIGIVINSEPFFQDSDEIKIYGSPVAYHDPEEFRLEIGRVAANIKAETEYLKALPRQRLADAVYTTLLFAAASLKHPGFKEEKNGA